MKYMSWKKFRKSIGLNYINTNWKMYQIHDRIASKIDSAFQLAFSLEDVRTMSRVYSKCEIICIADNFIKDGIYIVIEK